MDFSLEYNFKSFQFFPVLKGLARKIKLITCHSSSKRVCSSS